MPAARGGLGTAACLLFIHGIYIMASHVLYSRLLVARRAACSHTQFSRSRTRGRALARRARSRTQKSTRENRYTGALLSLRGGGGAPLQGPGSPGSRCSFSARLRLACFCSLRNCSAAAANHSGSSAASAASAAFAAAAGGGGGRCTINSLPHSGHRTTVRFFCKLTPSVALHRGHEKLEGWGGGLGFLGFGDASSSSGWACRRSMDVSTKWSISACPACVNARDRVRGARQTNASCFAI